MYDLYAQNTTVTHTQRHQKSAKTLITHWMFWRKLQSAGSLSWNKSKINSV